MIDSAQKRSSASRLGTLSVYRPVGTINSASNRINQAWWYAGIILPTDNFFFWREDANDGKDYEQDEDSDFHTEQTTLPSTTWGVISGSVSSYSSEGDSALAWEDGGYTGNSAISPMQVSQQWSGGESASGINSSQSQISSPFSGDSRPSDNSNQDSDSSSSWSSDEQIYDRN